MTTMRLRYIPLPGSHHVYLNGIEQREGTDWSDDGTGLLTFLAPMGQVTHDQIDVEYAHHGEVVPPLPGTFVAAQSNGSFSNSTATLSLPTNIAGDFMLAFYASNGPDVADPAGWTLLDQLIRTASDGHRVKVYTKVSTGSEPTALAPSLAGLTWYNWYAVSYRGGFTHVGEIEWLVVTPPGTPQPSPSVTGSNRAVYYANNSDPNGGWTIDAPATSRGNANAGNGDTHCIADCPNSGASILWHPSRPGTASLATLELAA